MWTRMMKRAVTFFADWACAEFTSRSWQSWSKRKPDPFDSFCSAWVLFAIRLENRVKGGAGGSIS